CRQAQFPPELRPGGNLQLHLGHELGAGGFGRIIHFHYFVKAVILSEVLVFQVDAPACLQKNPAAWIQEGVILAGGEKLVPEVAFLGQGRTGQTQEAEKQRESCQAPNHFVRPLRSEEHTSELQSRENLVCRLLLEKKNTKT